MSRTLLPNGWADGIVGDYVYLKNGFAFKSNSYVPAGEETFPIIRISDLDGQNATDVHAVHVVNGVDGFEVHKGDLLIAMSGATTGKIGIYNGVEPAYQNQRVGNIKLHSELYGCNRFKNHLISSLSTQIIKIAYGGAQPNISSKDIDKIEILFPPLAEQKEIADRLDTLLARVEATQARLARIPDIIKQFRQSVLAAAVSGKLTAEWREKHNENNNEVSNDSLLSYFRGKVLPILPRNWHWLRFDQVAEIASNLVSPAENPDAIHIAPNHIDSWTGTAYGFQTIVEDGVTSAKHEFKKGQILYSKIRPYLAKVVIAEFDGLCSADMYPINSKINTNYLFRWMLTSDFTEWASNAESRSVLPKINQKDLSQIPVPTPQLDEQAEIVRRVEQLFAYADTLEQQVKAAKERVNKLTQAILDKAFRGELTADWRAANPHLISGDNSAEALLARIQAERATAKPRKRATKNIRDVGSISEA